VHRDKINQIERDIGAAEYSISRAAELCGRRASNWRFAVGKLPSCCYARHRPSSCGTTYIGHRTRMSESSGMENEGADVRGG